MDSRKVNELAERFKDRVLRLTPLLFSQLGIVKNSISLKFEEFRVSCIPFDLSLSSASLLAVLDEKEVEYFNRFIGRPEKLMLTRNSPYATKPVNFFIPLKITAIKKPAGSNHCFIQTAFGPAPQDFKEMLVGYFFEMEQAEEAFSKATDEPMPEERILDLLGSTHLSLLSDACEAERLKILSFSLKRLRVFGEFAGTIPLVDAVLEFEPFEGDSSCVIRGKCAEMRQLGEAPGFYFLELEQSFSPALVCKSLKKTKKIQAPAASE